MTNALTTTTPQRPDHRTLVALTPADVPGAQKEIADWCTQQIVALTQERSDLLDSMRVAVENNWAVETLGRLERRTGHRITYYEKIKAAVEAGYLIVPNFDVEVMAVRVKGKARFHASDYSSVKITEAISTLPPVGEGRYVDEKLKYRHQEYEVADPKAHGGKRTVHHYQIDSYDEQVGFPVLAVKAEVMSATARAMSLKIFDRIGVVTGKREDPIVVGQIIHPDERSRQYYRDCKKVSFFVAWWLDTRSL